MSKPRTKQDEALREGYQAEAARQQAQPMKDVRTPPRTIHVYPTPEVSREQNRANRADMEKRGLKVWPKGYGR